MKFFVSTLILNDHLAGQNNLSCRFCPSSTLKISMLHASGLQSVCSKFSSYPLWRAVRKFLKKIKTELPYNPDIPLLDIYPEKNLIQKYTRTPVLTAALFTIAKTWKQAKCPLTEERIKIHMHNEI